MGSVLVSVVQVVPSLRFLGSLYCLGHEQLLVALLGMGSDVGNNLCCHLGDVTPGTLFS